MSRQRLDLVLVERGLCDSRTRAQGVIRAGLVLVDEVVIDKPGTQIPADAEVRVKGEEHPYVSRGGLKLAHALDTFHIDPVGLVCADLGASTGGFTDCLLQRGAARVYAIDVGYGQLAWKLRQDDRVVVRERTNVRHLEALEEPIQLVVADLSFISVTKVAPAMKRIAGPAARGVILVKPQFEVGPDRVARGGVVSDEAARSDAVDFVIHELGRSLIASIETAESPIRGAKKGNKEYLLHIAFT